MPTIDLEVIVGTILLLGRIALWIWGYVELRRLREREKAHML